MKKRILNCAALFGVLIFCVLLSGWLIFAEKTALNDAPVRQKDISGVAVNAISVADIDGVEKLYHEIMERNECVSLKMLAVTGKDLIAAGMKPGKEIGQMLEHFLDLVLEHPELNQKEELLKRIEF